MIRFDCDYNEGAHPKVLDKLIQTNAEQTSAYGMDPYCAKAAIMIKEKCDRQDVDVHFLSGGTQTNLTFISAALRPHQGVIAAVSGHINTHESGAIEGTGHKILAIESTDGKLTAGQIQKVYLDHISDVTHEHMVQPKLVYISNPTEIGTIYSKDELFAIHQTCRMNDLILYMDGARLGYALTAEDGDLDLPTIAKLCDAFYIGGTKVGTLFGEALIICRKDLGFDFRYLIKQKGALLAKGRLLGLQFLALFEDDLYFEISRKANGMAKQIKEACSRKGYHFLTPSSTNQQFPILPNRVLEQLREKYIYSYWQKIDEDNSAVRFCTSWATDAQSLNQLITDIENT